MEDLDRLETLVAIMDRLRDPGGCPWDREQDYDSLRGYLLEECHEVAEALDGDDPRALCEELGDLLFQIVFLSRIAREREEFAIGDVIRGIAEKMIRRHPHVFGSARADTAEEVVDRWEQIKRGERAAAGRAQEQPASLLDGLPQALPPVLKARRLGERAARVGFDWNNPEQVLDKLEEELGELRRAHAAEGVEAIRGELGDVLFTLVMLARKLRVDPESALSRTNDKFVQRFSWMERELTRAGESIEEAGSERLEQLWDRSKSGIKRL